MTSTFRPRTSYTVSSRSFAFSAMTMTFEEMPAMSESTLRCIGVGSESTVWSVVTTGMFNRDSSVENVRAGIATENAELMLQRYGIELPRIQGFSRARVVLEAFRR